MKKVNFISMDQMKPDIGPNNPVFIYDEDTHQPRLAYLLKHSNRPDKYGHKNAFMPLDESNAVWNVKKWLPLHQAPLNWIKPIEPPIMCDLIVNGQRGEIMDQVKRLRAYGRHMYQKLTGATEPTYDPKLLIFDV